MHGPLNVKFVNAKQLKMHSMPEKLSLLVDCSFKSLDVLPGCHDRAVLL